MSNYEIPWDIHPWANRFPLINGDEFADLIADIAANGVKVPLVFDGDGRLLDGRNRARAAIAAGVDPGALPSEIFDGDERACADLVISLNAKRRHLNSSQLAFIAVEYKRAFEPEAKERQREAGKVHGRGQKVQETIPEPFAPQSRDRAASVVGTNPRYVSDAERIEREAPELAAAIIAGDKTIPQAKRELKERQREARRQENRAKVESSPRIQSAIPDGTRFATILADPPWDWGDEGDQDQLGRARPDYATLSIAQLHDLRPGGRHVSELADVDAHLYLWITNRSLPKGFALLEDWGFRYVTAITWCKPSFGMGNYFRGQTEHLLFGVRGSQPLKRKDIGTVFHAKRGPAGHSSKPSEIYNLIESCSPGPYLELFSRIERPDWVAWGEG